MEKIIKSVPFGQLPRALQEMFAPFTPASDEEATFNEDGHCDWYANRFNLRVGVGGNSGFGCLVARPGCSSMAQLFLERHTHAEAFLNISNKSLVMPLGLKSLNSDTTRPDLNDMWTVVLKPRMTLVIPIGYWHGVGYSLTSEPACIVVAGSTRTKTLLWHVPSKDSVVMDMTDAPKVESSFPEACLVI